MKRSFSILLLAMVTLFSACNKEKINNTDEKVGISRVTNFATFQFSGAKYVAIVKGSAYAEPGVKAFEAGAEIPVTVSGTVNTNTPGLYILTYSAKNKDGFPATTQRTVVVLNSHEVPGTDLSGSYSYVGSSTYVSTVTKVAEGTYTTDNVWSGLTVIPMVFVSLDGLTLSIPTQQTAYGTAFGTGTFNPTTKRLVYTVTLADQGISNSNRTWQKQ